jgi:predicted TIM-barrel fold metal-dependent hydrolase
MVMTKASQTVRANPVGSNSIIVDTHAHVFERRLPMVRERRYTPVYDATVAEYLAMLDEHGVDFGVLVQPSFLGTDNGYLLHGLQTAPGRLRGVVVVDPATPIAALRSLDAHGVVGIRLNLIGRDIPPLDAEPWTTLFRNAAALGWSIAIQRPANDLELILPVLLRTGAPIIADHFGLPGAHADLWCATLKRIRLGDGPRRLWIKLSAPYRMSGGGRGEEIARTIYPVLRDIMGVDRLLWGSDWPHTEFERRQSYAQAKAWLNSVVAYETERAQMSTNALTLFRFDRDDISLRAASSS